MLRTKKSIFAVLFIFIAIIFGFSFINVNKTARAEEVETVSNSNFYIPFNFGLYGYSSTLPSNATRYSVGDPIDPNSTLYFLKTTRIVQPTTSIWHQDLTYSLGYNSSLDYNTFSIYSHKPLFNNDVYIFWAPIYSNTYLVLNFNTLFSDIELFNGGTIESDNTLFNVSGALDIYAVPNISLTDFFNSYNIGYDKAYEELYQSRYDAGWTAGYNKGNNDLTEFLNDNHISDKISSNPSDIITNGFVDFFTAPLLGSISLFHIAISIFGILFFIVLLKRLV